ncbi:MAG TPA: CcmD family protein [Anaerolineales bacterium]|nr:CcmD family protein [Anaerolineales bacterium]
MIQTIPPDTSAYMIGGYLFIFSVLGLYLASLVIRRRNLMRELEILQQIESPEVEEVGVHITSPGESPITQ